MNDLKGQALAEEALRICHLKEGNYPTGITVEDLEREIRLQGVRIASDNHLTALRSALNNSQAKGTWRNADVGMWLPGDGVSKSATGLSGRPLAEALYDALSARTARSASACAVSYPPSPPRRTSRSTRLRGSPV
jgi:hypothetical protein